MSLDVTAGRGAPRRGAPMAACALLAATLALIAALLVPIAYLGALVNGVIAPMGVTDAQGRALAAVLSPAGLAVFGALAALVLACVIVVNAHRLRRALATLAAAAALCAALLVVLGLCENALAGLLPVAWQGAVTSAAGGLADLAFPCACALAALSAALLSAYASVRLVKGGNS